MTTTTLKKELRRALNENERKWTPELLAGGFTTVPSILLERQEALGLDPIDLNILMQLAKYWWYAPNLPRPGVKSLAKTMSVDIRTVQRHLARLENGGLIKRIGRTAKDGSRQANEYSFQGLIQAATPFALEAKAEREKQRKEKEERLSHKRPKLSLVQSEADDL